MSFFKKFGKKIPGRLRVAACLAAALALAVPVLAEVRSSANYSIVDVTDSGGNVNVNGSSQVVQTVGEISGQASGGAAQIFHGFIGQAVADLNIVLSANSIAENQPAGTTVGTLSVPGQDAGDTATFTLVSGAGGDDNASFAIAGTNLQSAASFDFETKNSYSIRVRATNSGGLFFEQQFTINVTGVNETPPTDISLSSTSIAENQPSGTTVGTLSDSDQDAGDPGTFTLASGTGSTDNGSFTIIGAALRTAASFNFEVKNSFSIRVRVTDSGGLFFEKQFTITVTNVNEAPLNIALSSTNIAGNLPSGTTAATLSDSDPDAGDTVVFTLVSGTGSTDNGSFAISGTNLQTAASFGSKTNYNIRLRATDGGGLFIEKQFSIHGDQAPTVAVANASINGHVAVFLTNNGTFSDPDGNATVTLTASVGAITQTNATGTWSWRYAPTVANASPLTVTITATDNANPPLVRTTTFTYTASDALIILRQPQPVSVLVGGDAGVFSVLAFGHGTLGYQWKQNGTALAGATNSALVFNPAYFTNAGTYTVDVSDAAPSNLTSIAAMLTVRSPAPGEVDLSYPGGEAINGQVNALSAQSDGKVVMGGTFTSIGGEVSGFIARVNGNGSTDYSFGRGLAGADNNVLATAVQSDGKVVIGGQFTNVNGVARSRIARLNTDGSLDITFGDGLALASSNVQAIAVQSDGKLVIGGLFTNLNGTTINRIARLNTDGSLDTTFGNGLTGVGNAPFGAGGSVKAVAVQSDGSVVIGGTFTNINGSARTNLARLNSDGTLDTSFGTARGANAQVNAVTVQSDGKIVIGGSFNTINGTTQREVARLNSNGTLDTAFVGTNIINNTVNAVSVQSDGKVVIGGLFTTNNGTVRGRIARLNTDGSLDTTFGNGLAGASSTVNAVALQSNGKVVIGGNFTNVNGVARWKIAQLNSNGTSDAGFDNGETMAGLDSSVADMALQSDGKLVIVGNFTTINGIAHPSSARLHDDGTLDATFNAPTNDLLNRLVIQSDGHIIFGGDFNFGTNFTGSARSDSDGTLDPASTNVTTGNNRLILGMALRSDGKVYIGGTFTNVNGILHDRIARLNSDGTLDTTFGTGLAGLNGSILSAAAQSDGKVIIGGVFTTVNGVTNKFIARLNNDGSLDTGFFVSPINFGTMTIWALAVQNDGKVLVGGSLSITNGMPFRTGIVRVNTDGSLDTTFGYGLSGADGQVFDIAVQDDGKILIGGDFTNVNGVAHGGIARLNTDGSLDTGFANGAAGADNEVDTIAVQSDGKVLIGGQFTSVNGLPRRYLARLWGSTPSANADLSNLTLDSATLSPSFDSATMSYSAMVPNTTTSITVTPTVADPNATVTVNGVSVASGTAIGPIALNSGNNVITVTVTAQDVVTTKTYTLTVTRGFLPMTINLINNANNQLTYQFAGTPNTSYILESTTDLNPPVDWEPVLTNSTDANGAWTIAISSTNDLQRFFRIVGQ